MRLHAHGAQGADEDDLVELFKPVIEGRGAVGLPEETGVLEAGAQHPLPTLAHQCRLARLDIGGGQEVRQQLPVRATQAKALLVGLHAGQQDLGRKFQKFFVKSAEHGAGRLDQIGDLVEQGVKPLHVASHFRRQPVAFGPDGLLAVGRVKDDLALVAENPGVFVGMGDAERAGTHDPMTAGLVGRVKAGKGKGHYPVIEHGQNPAHGAAKGAILAHPLHFLWKSQIRQNRHAGLSQNF